MLLLATLASLIFGSPIKVAWPKPAKFSFAYFAFTGLSLFWTEASSLSSAAGYWLGLAADLLFVLVLFACEDGETVAISAVKGFVLGTVAVALIAWTAPGTPDLRMGQEDYLHPNALGYQFALAALLAIYLALRYRTASYWWLVASLDFSLTRTLSKSSILAFSGAAVFYIFFRAPLAWRRKLKIAAVHIILTVLSWPFVSFYVQEYSQTAAVGTLTGRTVIWASSWEIASERPWIGHGFYSYRSVVPFFGEFEAWQAHNDLLQQFFSYGTVGLLLACAVYISLFRYLRRSRSSPEVDLGYGIFVFGLIHGLTEANHIDLAIPVRLIVLFVVWCNVASRGSGKLHSANPDRTDSPYAQA